MLNIDATDEIEGIASVADKVEFTCSVVDGTTVKSSEGLLSDSQTQIYLATGATRILSLTLVNTHTSAVTVNVQKDPTDAGTLYRIIPKDLSLGIGHMLVFDGQRCTVMDASGNITSSLANPMDAAGELIYGGANGVMTALAAGATTKILVGGGAAAPVWTIATGTGAPVRAGAPTFTGQPIIPTIKLTGGQIAFPATAVPSADPNTLDDYEEGDSETTVTCDTSGSYTLSSASDILAYTKNGRDVHLQGGLTITGESSPNGTLQISLPFILADLTENAEVGHSTGIILRNHGDGGIENPILQFAPGVAYTRLYNITDTGGFEALNHTRFDTAFLIYINFTFIAA